MATGVREGVRRLGVSKLFLLLLFMLAACDGTVHHSFKPVPRSGWANVDTVEYIYYGSTRGDSLNGVDVTMQLRYDGSFKYKELRVRMETAKVATYEILSVDTLLCSIYDDGGQHRGATVGAMYQIESEKVRVAASPRDSLLVRISHIMPDSCVEGIYDIGVRIAAH